VTERLPDEVEINAWTGTEAARGELGPLAAKWASGGGLPHSQQPLLQDLARPEDWADPRVGYGVLLPDEPGLSVAEHAAGKHAPEPIRDLLAARPGTVVLGWAVSDTLGSTKLWRYFPDGLRQPVEIGLSNFGVAKAQLPRYVLIAGGPEIIPWSVQYTLGVRHAVGRLPLTGDALANYVQAMLDGWPGTDLDVRAPLMWTVDNPGDITAQMRAVLANPLAKELDDPAKLPRFEHLVAADATAAGLLARLRALRPALVVTSSHGLAGGAVADLRQVLGLPVDQVHTAVGLAELDAAMPAGTIWHAQACCSAGSEAPSRYLGLLAPNTSVATTVAAVAELGATVAPAALAMLGRQRPVRAVIGHVEPTFDWTLRVAETGQGLGHEVVTALSTNLFAGQPLGLAFAAYRTGVGQLHTNYANSFDELNNGHPEVRPTLTRLRLTAIDRQSMVLLGDPAVTLPPLAGAP
jgi:hypothetical protein